MSFSSFHQARLNEMMSQIRLRQSQAGERLGPGDGRYEVEDAMQEQLKQVSPAHVHWQMVIVEGVGAVQFSSKSNFAASIKAICSDDSKNLSRNDDRNKI